MIFKILGAAFGPLLFIQLSFAQANVDKGRRLYFSNCISCHNRDPNLKGAIGPEIVDAPIEIMRTKVLTGRYPEKLPAGFIPKRKTKLMRPIKKLEKDIPDIYAWVQSVKKTKKK